MRTGRNPDIEMVDADGHTVAVVEAKFSAYLTDGQVSACTSTWPSRCRGSSHRGCSSCSFRRAGSTRRSACSNG